MAEVDYGRCIVDKNAHPSAGPPGKELTPSTA
jgi:hypothetical protein